MSASPKRKSESPVNDTDASSSKKPRLSTPSTSKSTKPNPTHPPAPDALIDQSAALAYWSSTPATVSGVLGGFPEVSRVDLQGSANFLAKLRRTSPHPRLRGDANKKLHRAVDCGAGIGRITKGFLRRVAEVVDVVEPVRGFTEALEREIAEEEEDKSTKSKNGKGEAEKLGQLGIIYTTGLETWPPTPNADSVGPYDLIWNQWCVGQLTDAQFVVYLRRLVQPAHSLLSEGGWIVVKENLSNDPRGEDVFDETDSSVTRTDEKFRALFKEAGLKVVMSEVQRGMPVEGLYPVKAYALQPA